MRKKQAEALALNQQLQADPGNADLLKRGTELQQELRGLEAKRLEEVVEQFEALLLRRGISVPVPGLLGPQAHPVNPPLPPPPLPTPRLQTP